MLFFYFYPFCSSHSIALNISCTIMILLYYHDYYRTYNSLYNRHFSGQVFRSTSYGHSIRSRKIPILIKIPKTKNIIHSKCKFINYKTIRVTTMYNFSQLYSPSNKLFKNLNVKRSYISNNYKKSSGDESSSTERL